MVPNNWNWIASPPPEFKNHPTYFHAVNMQLPLVNLPGPKPRVRLPGIPKVTTIKSIPQQNAIFSQPLIFESSSGWQDKFNKLLDGKRSDPPAEKKERDFAEFSVTKLPFSDEALSVQPLSPISILLPGRKGEADSVGADGEMLDWKAGAAAAEEALQNHPVVNRQTQYQLLSPYQQPCEGLTTA